MAPPFPLMRWPARRPPLRLAWLRWPAWLAALLGSAAVLLVPAAGAGRSWAAAAAAEKPEGQPPAEELRGRVQLLAKGGKAPARGADLRLAVVYFEPGATGSSGHRPAASFQMVTRKKEFVPHVLAVPRGSRVIFPNQDPILHNVFSVSPGNAFDLGFYRAQAGKEKRFEQAGVVRVFCNVHQDMVGYIVVLDTPFYTSPAADGSFALGGLPRGPGRLTVWHEQADPWTANLALPPAAPVLAQLVVVHPQLAPHLNKTGEAYGSGRDRYERR
jgi:plastocyanin